VAELSVLIAVDEMEIGTIWAASIERMGAQVLLTDAPATALETIREVDIAVVVIGLGLGAGKAFDIANFTSYRRPDAGVVFVTNSTFFSDGSVFSHVTNARAIVPVSTPPDDLAMMVEHYANH